VIVEASLSTRTNDAVNLEWSSAPLESVRLLQLCDPSALVVDLYGLVMLGRAMCLEDKTIDGRPDQQSANKSHISDAGYGLVMLASRAAATP
jgi:hypothetical protein